MGRFVAGWREKQQHTMGMEQKNTLKVGTVPVPRPRPSKSTHLVRSPLLRMRRV